MIALIPSLCILAGSVSAWPLSPPRLQSRSLIVTPSPPTGSLDPCLRDNYYGAYGSDQEHIYLTTGAECQHTGLLSHFESGWLNAVQEDLPAGRFVWVGKAGVEGMEDYHVADAWNALDERASQLDAVSLEEMLKEEEEERAQLADSKQTPVFGLKPPHRPSAISLVHGSTGSMVLYVPDRFISILDTLLPPHLVPVVLPDSPLPFRVSATGWEPVPDRFAKHLANLTAHLKFDSRLDKIVSDGIKLNEIRRDVRWLTGEAPSGIESRHSFTPGAVKAAHWLKEKTEATGAECHLQPFLAGFSPNVICSYPSQTNSTELVILSAHYDSRGSWGSTRAPGGDDDGSGTGHLLAVAQAIGESEVKFDKKVILAFFAGEEQGLYGSHDFAQKLHEKNATVLLHIQADMLGYRAPGEPLQLGLPESIHLPEATYLVGNLSQLYSPELVLGRTAACCSDHQSFVAYGFPATAVFERNGPIADPKYHNSGDVSQREGYDFDQIVSIAKVTLASVLTVAEWSV